MAEHKGFWAKYKMVISIIGATIPIVVASAWLHNAYADTRYVQVSQLEEYRKENDIERLRGKRDQIDNEMFEIGQEIQFAETDQEKAKWEARKDFYQNQKEAIIEKLKQLK